MENKFDSALNFLVDESNWNCGEEGHAAFDVPGGLDYCVIKIYRKNLHSSFVGCEVWPLYIKA